MSDNICWIWSYDGMHALGLESNADPSAPANTIRRALLVSGITGTILH